MYTSSNSLLMKMITENYCNFLENLSQPETFCAATILKNVNNFPGGLINA